MQTTATLIFCAVLLLATPALAQENQAPQFDGVQGIDNPGTGSDLIVRWNPGTDPEGGKLLYKVYLATEAGQFLFGGPMVASFDTSVVVHGLTPGQTYYVIVRAEDEKGLQDANFNTLSAVPQRKLYETGFSACSGSSILRSAPATQFNGLFLLLLITMLGFVAVRTSATRRRG